MSEGLRPALPGLDAARVEDWLLRHVEGLQRPLEFQLIAGGHSNLTFSGSDAAGRRFVLRRPPLSTGSSKAHDMAREHLVLTALGPTSVPVPATLALCEDEVVNGRPFYVMDLIEGAVVDSPEEVARALPSAELRRRASEDLVDVLAALHPVDIDEVGLGRASRREAFLERQLNRMQGVWEQTKTRELPLLEEVHRRLAAARPPQRHTGIVHSDYRFGNVILGGEGRVAAVLDWELWTLGDVLSDVGFLLNNWYEPNDSDPQIWMAVPPTMAGGFASRQEVAERYAGATGFELDDIEFYRAFQYWKVAVLAEGVKRRYESGAMAGSNVDFDHLSQRVVDLVGLADRSLERLGR
jgi:aminoglycoside phosphotransferase (APT) family kinase protein